MLNKYTTESQDKESIKPLETTDYECFLPLDTPLLRTELLGRLQLALWSSKCHHSLTLKKLQLEQNNVSHLKFLFYTFLMLAVKKKMFQSTAFLENLHYLETLHFRFNCDENETHNSTLTICQNDSPSKHTHALHNKVSDHSIQISKLLFRFLHFLEKQLCEELSNAKQYSTTQNTIYEELNAFLDELTVLHGAQQDSMASDSPDDILNVSSVERNRLVMLLYDLQKQRDSLELLVDQCRKQVLTKSFFAPF
jgi:hypothetical protein